MAIPKCSKCGNDSFETNIVSPAKSNFKLQFVNCASCGTIVGTMDFFNTAKLLENMAIKLKLGDITKLD